VALRAQRPQRFPGRSGQPARAPRESTMERDQSDDRSDREERRVVPQLVSRQQQGRRQDGGDEAGNRVEIGEQFRLPQSDAEPRGRHSGHGRGERHPDRLEPKLRYGDQGGDDRRERKDERQQHKARAHTERVDRGALPLVGCPGHRDRAVDVPAPHEDGGRERADRLSGDDARHSIAPDDARDDGEKQKGRYQGEQGEDGESRQAQQYGFHGRFRYGLGNRSRFYGRGPVGRLLV
jgi:hypothetical protein